MKNRKVVVVGNNHYNTLGVIRSLGETGIYPYLFLVSEPNNRYVKKSKYITKTKEFRKFDNKMLDALEGEFGQEKILPLIIPTSDQSMSFLMEHYERLKVLFELPNMKEQLKNNNNFLNKYYLNDIAKKIGFSVPDSIVIKHKEKLTNEQIQKLKSPLIVKPLRSTGGNKKDIYIAKDASALKKYLESNSVKTNLLVQEYIEGKQSYMIEVLGCSLPKERGIVIPGVIKKIREYPRGKGSTSFAKVFHSNELLNMDMIEELILRTGYIGIFDLEFKYSDGKVYFIEMNFRNGAPSYAYTKAGINLPHILYSSYQADFELNLDLKLKQDFYFMMEHRDFRHVYERNLGFYNWFDNFVRSKSLLFLNVKDFKPNIYSFFEKVREM